MLLNSISTSHTFCRCRVSLITVRLFTSRFQGSAPVTLLPRCRTMHALPIKPNNVYYRREQEKEQHALPHLVGSPKPTLAGKLRPASPTKRGHVLTAHRLADPLQVGCCWAELLGGDGQSSLTGVPDRHRFPF